MKTLNRVVLVLVLASFGFASFGCGDDSSSPVAPSSTPMMEAPSYAPAGAPSVRPVSSSPDVDTVAPGDGRYGPNAYDFFAHVDSGMLRVALVEDAMATMRTASQPHRMRQVEVYHVISEPRHVLQTHGDPLYTGTVQLSGRLELPPIAVESCAPHEWIVVQAAEMSDDRYDGWRNAPCPQPGGVVVGSDGSGPGWERSEHGAPPRDFSGAPVITDPGDKRYQRGTGIEAFRIVVTGGDDVTVAVSGLPPGLAWSSDSRRVSGTVAADAEERGYPVTVTANDGTNDPVTATFTITIGARGENQSPKIGNQIDRQFSRGEDVQFTIVVTDPDDDETVAVSGLPPGLTWQEDPGRVQGTVAADAEERGYPVTVTANDGTNDPVTATFTITIAENHPPVISHPGDKGYQQGTEIEAFRIVVIDADGDDVTVRVSGLPPGLVWSPESHRVSGTVDEDAEVRAYPVRVTASDGAADAEFVTFRITVRPSWFNRENYNALVYNAYDGPIDEAPRVLDDNQLSSFKVVFSTVGLMPGGRICQIPQRVISQLADATVPAVQAATGSGWSVRPVQSRSPLDDSRFGLRPSADEMVDLDDPRANDGWHTVEFVHWDLIPGTEHGGPTGSAWAGYPDLPMYIYLNDNCTIAAIDRGGVPATYVHEIGHVLGFLHVDDSSWTMHPHNGMVRAFGGYAEDEYLHMRRAYQLGPDHLLGTRIWLRFLLQQPGPWPGRRTTRKPPPIMVDD